MGMHRDFGMLVRSEQLRTFQSDRAVAECGPFRAARDYADVLSHSCSGSLLSGEFLDLLEHLVQRRARVVPAAQYDAENLAGIANVLQGVRVQQDKIRRVL